jgi:hypothetical protein
MIICSAIARSSTVYKNFILNHDEQSDWKRSAGAFPGKMPIKKLSRLIGRKIRRNRERAGQLRLL